MTAYFITAVGTGVGKTFTTCALLHAALQKGRLARGLKPIISGYDAADAMSDTMQILEASAIIPPPTGGRLGGGRSLAMTAQRTPPPQPSPHGGGSTSALPYLMESIDSISPWRFAAPLSPHRAAALAQQTLDVDALLAWSRARITGEGLTLIEGVGGVMVPLTNHYTSLDWMAALGLPVILVTGSYLGSISHTLTALHALRARGLTVQALVISETEDSSVTLDEAIAGLAPFIADIPLRIVQPRVSSWREATAIHALEL